MTDDILDVIDKFACFLTFHDFKRLNDKIYIIDYKAFRPCKCTKCGKKQIVEIDNLYFRDTVIVNNKQEIWDDYYKDIK